MTSQKIFELAIAPQTAKGVPATLATLKTRITGGDVTPISDVQKLAETGSNRLSRVVLKLSAGVDGNPEVAVREALAGLLLWGSLGVKSASVRASTDLAAASVIGATNIKVTAITNIAIGDTLRIGTGVTAENRDVLTVGTAGAAGTGITLTTALASAHSLAETVVEAEVTHTITPANSLPFFTLWRSFGEMVWEKFIDCKVSQLEMVSEAASQVGLRMTATLVGAKALALTQATYNTEVTVAYDDTSPFVHHHASGLLLVEGVAVTRTERVALTIANGVSRQFGDSIYADDVSEGAQSIMVATRERVVTPALWNRLHYGSANPATGTEPTGAVLELGTGGLNLMWRRLPIPSSPAGTPERSIRIASGSRVQVSGIGAFAPATGDDPIRQEPTYEILDPDAGAALTATVVNDVTAY